MRQRNNALQAEVQDLKKGLDAIEERARSELGMIREKEEFYQIVDDPKTKGVK
jgi:cell division protein FtsB